MKDFYSFACTHLGFSHLSSKKPCQDFSMHLNEENWSAAIVSDGHGSANFTRSDRGSRFACEAARDAVMEFLREVNPEDLRNPASRDGVVLQLCKNILLRWNNRVDEDAALKPFTPEEVEKVADKYKARYLSGSAVEHAYGATLIIAVVTRDFFLAIRNGDGQCVAVDEEGVFSTPIPWNDNCEFNVTTSLCDHEAIDNFRYCYSEQLPAAVFVGSDGVDDSYTSVEELYHLYRSLCMKALDEGAETIGEYVAMLLPEITKRGSTDDVSISGLINVDALQTARTAMEIARELRQIQLEEQKRQQQRRILERDIKVAEKKRKKAQEQIREVQEKLRRIGADRTGFQRKLAQYQERLDSLDKVEPGLQQNEAYYESRVREADLEIQKLALRERELQEQRSRTAGSVVLDADFQPVMQDSALAMLKVWWQELQKLLDAARKNLTQAQSDLQGTQSQIRKNRFDRKNLQDEIARLRSRLNGFAAEESRLMQEEEQLAQTIRDSDQEIQRLTDKLWELDHPEKPDAAQSDADGEAEPEDAAAEEAADAAPETQAEPAGSDNGTEQEKPEEATEPENRSDPE